MTLATHSDSGYLNEPEACSRAGGQFLFSKNTAFPPKNGKIFTISQIINNVMSSASEAELGAFYIAAREAAYIRIILE